MSLYEIWHNNAILTILFERSGDFVELRVMVNLADQPVKTLNLGVFRIHEALAATQGFNAIFAAMIKDPDYVGNEFCLSLGWKPEPGTMEHYPFYAPKVQPEPIKPLFDGKKQYARIPYGQESGAELYPECKDCQVAIGEYHQVGCDKERCPKCNKQAITCDCFGQTNNQGIPDDVEEMLTDLKEKEEKSDE